MNLKEKLDKNKLYGVGLSLIMAIFLWSWVIGVENPEINMPFRGIDVEYDGTSYLQKEGLSVISPQKPKVNIEINGTKSDLARIDSHNFKASLDLQGLKPGENKVPVDYSLIGQTGGVRIINVEPATILVNIDEIVTENKQITIETLGDLPASYTLGNLRAINNFVRVTGPSSKLNQIAKVVAYVDINEKTESFMSTAKILYFDKNNIELKNVEASSENVDLEIPIYKFKSVPLKLSYFGNLGEDKEISNILPEPNTVVIRGNKEAVDKVSQIETEAFNVSNLVSNENFTPKLNLPEGITLHEDTSIKVKFDYKESKEKTILVPLSDIIINNQNNQLNYNITNQVENIEIKIYGESSAVDAITNQDISLSIDSKNLEVGQHQLNINHNEIEGVTFRSLNPQLIALDISQNQVEEEEAPEENSEINNSENP